MHQTIMKDFEAYEEYLTPYGVVFILFLLHHPISSTCLH